MAEGIKPPPDWQTLDTDRLWVIVRESGIAGMSGAGFPTHEKLKLPLGKTLSLLLVNCVESDPFLTSDYRLLLEHPRQIFEGIHLMMKLLHVDHTLIGARANMPGIAEVLAPLLEKNPGIDLLLLEDKYPQGDERQLVFAATGRELRSAELPWDVGVMVFNVVTAWALGSLLSTGVPLIERPVTVGGAVVKPGNFMVRIGTPIEKLIAAAGGFATKQGRIVLGSPMTGRQILDLKTPVTKLTNAVLVMDASRNLTTIQTNCIHCGRCLSVCPYRLMPLYMVRASQKGDVGKLKRYNVSECRECAGCAYICPAKLPLLQYIRAGKELIRTNAVEEENADE